MREQTYSARRDWLRQITLGISLSLAWVEGRGRRQVRFLLSLVLDGVHHYGNEVSNFFAEDEVPLH